MLRNNRVVGASNRAFNVHRTWSVSGFAKVSEFLVFLIDGKNCETGKLDRLRNRDVLSQQIRLRFLR